MSSTLIFIILIIIAVPLFTGFGLFLYYYRRSKTKLKDKEKIIFLPIFIVLGIVVGFLFEDRIMHESVIGISSGIIMGSGIGGILDYINNRRRLS